MLQFVLKIHFWGMCVGISLIDPLDQYTFLKMRMGLFMTLYPSLVYSSS